MLARKACRGFPYLVMKVLCSLLGRCLLEGVCFGFVLCFRYKRMPVGVNLPSLDLSPGFVRRWVAGSDVTRCLAGRPTELLTSDTTMCTSFIWDYTAF